MGELYDYTIGLFKGISTKEIIKTIAVDASAIILLMAAAVIWLSIA